MIKRAMRFDGRGTQSSLTMASTVDVVEKISAVRAASVASDEERKKWKKLSQSARKLGRWRGVDGFYQLKTADYFAVSHSLRSCIALGRMDSMQYQFCGLRIPRSRSASRPCSNIGRGKSREIWLL